MMQAGVKEQLVFSIRSDHGGSDLSLGDAACQDRVLTDFHGVDL